MQVPTHIETFLFQGLECFRLRTGAASAIVSRLGAQVLSWIDADGRQRLFLSERAKFDGAVAIRGGIPVCFPQFSGLGDLPKHGFVRTRLWDRVLAPGADASASLTLRCADNAATRALWPHAFEVRIEVTLGLAALAVGLFVRNTDAAPISFTGALHTYLAVDDIDALSLYGLQGLTYRDAAKGNPIRTEGDAQLRFAQEVDRVYHAVQGPLTLGDGAHTLSIAASGFPDVVVWNPWQILCRGLPDMLPTGYRQMVCVEAAVAQVPAIVAPGQEWTGSQTLRLA